MSSTPHLYDRTAAAFVDALNRLSDRQLARKYPSERKIHMAMLARGRTGEASVSDELRSFRGFLRAIGRPQPSPTWSVDRKDPHDPEYSAENIQWADKRQQANNRRNTIHLQDANGENRPLADWARLRGVNPNTLHQRLRRGWTHPEVISGVRNRASTVTRPATCFPSKWPRGFTPERWEPHYLAWLRTIEAKRGATRAVFGAWIERARVWQLEKELEERYPDIFDPAVVDPDGITPDVPPSDAQYQQLILHRGLFQAARSGLNAEESLTLRSLRGVRVLEPSKAAKAMRDRRG